MIKTLDQAKALIRATVPKDRLDLLTEIYLETDSSEVERFTENYRWVLGASHRKQLKKDVAHISRFAQEALISAQDGCNEVDGEE